MGRRQGARDNSAARYVQTVKATLTEALLTCEIGAAVQDPM
jgi:hypothetical protein